MRKITKLRRSIRAVSPVISILLMIAIAVVASIMAYAWVMGYIGFQTEKSGNQIQIQSYTTSGYLVIYVQNTGQGTVHLKQDSSVYVNDVLKNIREVDGTDYTDKTGALIPITVGQTVKVVVDYQNFHAGDRIKVVTTEGTVMQTTGSSGSGSSGGSSGTTTSPAAGFTFSPSAPAVGDTVYFTDASVAGSGTINGWSWNFGDGATGTTQNPTHVYSTAATVTVSLAVTDSNGKSSTVTHTLTVGGTGPASPVAAFTYTPLAPVVGDTVYFTDASVAGGGTINQWSWNFGDGTTSTTHNPSHAYLAAGTETVSLTVTDTNGKTSTTTQTIQISSSGGGSGTTDPAADFTFSPSAPAVGDTVYFTDASVAGSGTINGWSWNFGDGATGTTQNPTHVYSTAATVTVSLTVTDSNGKTSTATRTLTVGSSSTTAPVADFTFSPSAPKAGDTVAFTDTSVAGSGTINGWSWNFGDTSTSTTQNPTHIYSVEGTYIVSLTVTDSNGKTSTATQTIQISTSGGGGSGDQVQVNFNVNPAGSGTTTPTGTKTYTVGATDTFTATPSGSNVFSSWTFQGPIQIANPTSSSTSATINGAGTVTANFISSTSNKLVYTAGAGQTLLTGQPSSIITVTRETSSNAPITGSQWTVTLSASSGTLYSDQYCTQLITGPISPSSSASSTSFYYIATTTDTPTITASASGYASVSTTFIINSPTSAITLPSSTGFDGSSWESGWDIWANPPWTSTSDSTHVYSPQRSATSIRSNQGAFSSNPMDATGAKYITVSFEYMVYQTDPTDLQIRYSGTTASDYRSDMWTILGATGSTLGSATGGKEAGTAGGTWHQYTATITDPTAFTTYFRLSFLSQNLDSRSQVWVDNIVITVYK